MQGRARQSDDDSGGAPEWMVTFSDCMTLLLTFFVLLLSFSSFDEKTFRKLNMIFSGKLPSVSPHIRKDKDAFLPTEQIQPTEELDKGSEKPTLASGKQDYSEEETEPEDFRQLNVFVVPSNRIFWGKGRIISLKGRRLLSSMALLLKEVPNRTVVSESGPGDIGGNNSDGLGRAWSVVEYLTTKGRLDKGRFNISKWGIMGQENLELAGQAGQETAGERVVEITLLERSICN
jgi:chemotaxis protein MotB